MELFDIKVRTSVPRKKVQKKPRLGRYERLAAIIGDNEDVYFYIDNYDGSEGSKIIDNISLQVKFDLVQIDESIFIEDTSPNNLTQQF
jgi:hypothetical protein